MYGSQSTCTHDCHTFVSYFHFFPQMSTISRVFGLQLWNLACITNFDMLFLVMGFISLVDEI